MSGQPPIGAVCWACGHVHRDESGCGAGPKPQFTSWPCHRTPGNQCIHQDCFEKLPKENVVAADFGGRPYIELGTMAEEIRAVIDKYALRVSLAETTGVLEIVKLELFNRALLE